MRLLGSMACAGSVVVSLYLMFRPVLRRFFGAKYRYRILIMALLFYLAPVQLGRDFGQNMSPRYIVSEDQEGHKVYDMTGSVIEVTREGKIYTSYMAAKITMFAVWSITAVTVIFAGLSAYGKQRRMLVETGEDITDKEILKELEAMRTGLRIRRRVRYRWNPDLNVPLSVGVLRPVLVLPEQRYHGTESRFIYEHELLHIKNYDTLFRLLGLLAIGFNWYNPLPYLLFRELGKVSEHVCDEQIALHCGDEQRVRYGHLILDMATEGKKSGLTYAAPFGSSKENVKERISLMMKTRKLKTGMRLLAVCCTAVIGLSGSIPVLAYKKPAIVWDLSGEDRERGALEEEFFVQEGFEGSADVECRLFMDVTRVNVKELPAESYFQDLQGNIYPDEERIEQRACSHTYVNGTQYEHKKSGDGCTLYVYNARQCSKCGNVLKDSLAYELKYPKCPH